MADVSLNCTIVNWNKQNAHWMFFSVQMDARSLAMEMAPVIMWQNERRPEGYRQFWNPTPKSISKKSTDSVPTYTAWDMLAGERLNFLLLVYKLVDKCKFACVLETVTSPTPLSVHTGLYKCD